MKVKVLAGLIGACCGAPVFAQSNVTMYGILDAGIQVSRFGNGTQTNLVSGIADGSRLGFKGMEDLGGGYRAIFNLEMRVEADTGGNSPGYLVTPTQNVPLTEGLPAAVAAKLGPTILGARVNSNNAAFDRQAYVGLVTPMGTISLGRQYSPSYEVAYKMDTFETGSAGALITGIMNGTGGIYTAAAAGRVNKSLQYRFQARNGIGGSVMVGLAGDASTGSANMSKRYWGTNVTYRADGLDVGAAYSTETDQNGKKSLTSTTVGGSYTMGNARLFAGYHRSKNDNTVLVPLMTPLIGAANAEIIGNNAKMNADIYTVGMQYRIGAGRILGVVSHNNDKKASNSDATLVALGYIYDLSKRTDVYTTVGHIANKNHSQRTPGAAGYFSGFSSAPGQGATAYQFGVRHRF
jgi:predicted porin